MCWSKTDGAFGRGLRCHDRRGQYLRAALGVISQRRWFPAVRRVREAIDAGKIGVPALGQVIMLGWRDEAYYRSDPWRGSWAGEGGGVLANQAPHQLDLMQWFMGPIAEVCAYWDNLNHPYIEVEDTAIAIFRCQNGALGNILVSNSQKPGIYAKVHVHGRSGASLGCRPMAAPCSSPACRALLNRPRMIFGRFPAKKACLSNGERRRGAFQSD